MHATRFFILAMFTPLCCRPTQFGAGEPFFSVIIAEGEQLIRSDIAADNWQGPPPHTVGWWRSSMPPAGPRKLKPAPDSVLLETLSQLVERPESEALAYLLAVLLVRRRVLTEDPTWVARPPTNLRCCGICSIPWMDGNGQFPCRCPQQIP